MADLPYRTMAANSDLGAAAAQPASGAFDVAVNFNPATRQFAIDVTLIGARITVTDAAGSGSSGSLKLFTFAQAALAILGARQNYTKFREGTALTTAAGDAAFVMGLGSAAANAGDGALTGTEVDIGAVTATMTLSGSPATATGTKISGAGLNTSAGLDGTSTAIDIYLNWSGSAATIDATSTIDVWGTLTIAGVLLGDD